MTRLVLGKRRSIPVPDLLHVRGIPVGSLGDCAHVVITALEHIGEVRVSLTKGRCSLYNGRLIREPILLEEGLEVPSGMLKGAYILITELAGIERAPVRTIRALTFVRSKEGVVVSSLNQGHRVIVTRSVGDFGTIPISVL